MEYALIFITLGNIFLIAKDLWPAKKYSEKEISDFLASRIEL